MTPEEYCTAHSSAEPAHLARLYRHTYLTRLYPHMCCEPLQGRLLVMLTRMIAPHRILELGTFSGYSTLCFAEGMPEGAQLHTVEIDDEAEDSLRETFDASPRAADIHLHIADALRAIPELSTEPWDLVFIDANKRLYCDYYRLVKPHLRPGGYILADNTLWGGKLLDESARDAQSRGIDDFNRLVADDPDVEVVMLPLRDGLTIIRVKE